MFTDKLRNNQTNINTDYNDLNPKRDRSHRYSFDPNYFDSHRTHEEIFRQFESLHLKAETIARKDPFFAIRLDNLTRHMVEGRKVRNLQRAASQHSTPHTATAPQPPPPQPAQAPQPPPPQQNFNQSFHYQPYYQRQTSYHTYGAAPQPPPPQSQPQTQPQAQPQPQPQAPPKQQPTRTVPPSGSSRFHTSASFARDSFTHKSQKASSSNSHAHHSYFTKYSAKQPNLLFVIEDDYDPKKITVQMTRIQLGPNGEQQRVIIERDFNNEQELNVFLNEFEEKINKVSSKEPKSKKGYSTEDDLLNKSPGVVVVEEPGEEPRLYRQDTGELVTDANGFLRGSNGFFHRRSQKEQRSHRFRKENPTVPEEPAEKPTEEEKFAKEPKKHSEKPKQRNDVIIEENNENEKEAPKRNSYAEPRSESMKEAVIESTKEPAKATRTPETRAKRDSNTKPTLHRAASLESVTKPMEEKRSKKASPAKVSQVRESKSSAQIPQKSYEQNYIPKAPYSFHHQNVSQTYFNASGMPQLFMNTPLNPHPSFAASYAQCYDKIKLLNTQYGYCANDNKLCSESCVFMPDKKLKKHSKNCPKLQTGEHGHKLSSNKINLTSKKKSLLKDIIKEPSAESLFNKQIYTPSSKAASAKTNVKQSFSFSRPKTQNQTCSFTTKKSFSQKNIPESIFEYAECVNTVRYDCPATECANTVRYECEQAAPITECSSHHHYQCPEQNRIHMQPQTSLPKYQSFTSNVTFMQQTYFQPRPPYYQTQYEQTYPTNSYPFVYSESEFKVIA